MSVVYFFVSIIFFLWVGRNVLFWVSLWQIKEYRLDRLYVHFRETYHGKTTLFSSLSIIKWVAIFSFIFVLFDDTFLILYQVFVAGIYFIQTLVVIREATQHKIKRPVFTIKADLLILLNIAAIVFLYSIPLVDSFFWLLLLDKLTPFIVSFFIFAFSFPTELYYDYQIQKAIKKIKEHKNLLVIGVTGSYGKSSTKEYIAQILDKKFKLLKTKGTNNTPIGVAKTILDGLEADTQIFVCEMGAYKIGEIAYIANMVFPKIGILTGVNDQHLSLFGSLQNTMKAKYELIGSLPKSGISLFNGNNSNSYNLYKQTKKKKVLYSSIQTPIQEANNEIIDDANITAFNIKSSKKLTTFDVFLQNTIIHFKTKLIGLHNIENILPGIYIAHYLGMDEKEIVNAVNSIWPLPKTFVLHQAAEGITLIDDSFNVNPDGILAALSYMKQYNGKRFLILEPMIELGKQANAAHYEVGKSIGGICDYLLLTKKNFYSSIVKGIEDSGGKCIVNVASTDEIAQFLTKQSKKGDIIIFEGKEAGVALNKIL